MSSVTIDGIVEITMGKRYIPPEAAPGTKALHIHYVSTIQTSSGVSVPVTLRKYAPQQDSVLPDETVVFIRGALNAPANEPAFIDCNQGFIVHSGDPKDEGYQEGVFDMPYLHVYAIGQVISHAELQDDGASRAFNLAVSEWVVDEIKHFTINCKIDGLSPRWKKTRAPPINNWVKVEGFFSHVMPNKVLGITVTHILFNPGCSSTQQPNVATTSASPFKKKRFNAIVPPSFGSLLPSSSPTFQLQHANNSTNDPALSATAAPFIDDSIPFPPPDPELILDPFVETTGPATSTPGAGPSAKKRGKRKATDVEQ